MKAARVSSNDVKIGDTLPWDVRDQNGLLLLKQGTVVTTERQRLTLIERGLYNSESTGKTDQFARSECLLEKSKGSFNPFEIIETCTFRLGRILYNLTQGQDCTDKLAVVIDAIMKTYDRDPDAALGAVHLLYGHAYTTIHPIDTATLCYVLCKAMDLPEQETQRIMAASLTSNIGMLDLQETLHEQTAPLSDEQFAQIKKHPEESVRMLLASGVKDSSWLHIILQHHERANGQGYPRKLKGDEILVGAKILALTDSYSAMITPREYKDSNDASKALQTLFLERGKEYDETLSVLLIKHMGVYPPGSYVKLANDEIAIVVRRTDSRTSPQVASIINARGVPYSRPIKRESDQAGYGVKAIVESPHKRLPFSLASLWGYKD